MMSMTIWILLMLWEYDAPKDSGADTRTDAKYLAFYSEKECEDEKKAFIIKQVNEAAKRSRIGTERTFSAGCSSITIKEQK